MNVTADLKGEGSPVVFPSAAQFSDALASMGHRFQTMCSDMRPVAAGFRISGAPAFTVRCYAGATWALEQALEEAPEGTVLVVDGGGYREAVLMGGLMSGRAGRRGLAGAVIDGATRDTEEIRKAGWPVFSVAITPRAGTHDQQGQWNVPISCGGVVVHPGDRVIADEDGVVIVPAHLWEDVLNVARKVSAREEFLEEGLRSGLSLAEAVGRWKAQA